MRSVVLTRGKEDGGGMGGEGRGEDVGFGTACKRRSRSEDRRGEYSISRRLCG